MKSVSIRLPWPPSVNHYYGRDRKSGHVFLKEAGRLYRAKAGSEFARLGWPRLNGRVRVNLILIPPDARRRDIDNIRKAVYDAISDRRGHRGIIADDADIREDAAAFADPDGAAGGVHITITEIGGKP